MTVRLDVQRSAWLAHVAATAATYPGIVPVVKGNGYGFGRDVLHPLVAGIADRVCVGSVHELDGIPADTTPIVLTPTLHVPPAGCDPILTVGAPAHVAALAGWIGRVVIKLASSMQRYGVAPKDLAPLTHEVASAGLTIDGAAIHLPLAGDDRARLAEIEAWLGELPEEWSLSVSHLAPDAYGELAAAHPRRRFFIRAGTRLWHGDKAFLHLGADVLDVRPRTTAGTAGYHARAVTAAGTLVLIGAGSANGVDVLADGSSPFHFGRERITLVEAPHMHTSMGFVGDGAPCPGIGEIVDVQRPLIDTHVDEIVWLS